MSPLALIAGIPRGLYTRVREKPACHGWQVQIIPSEDPKQADLRCIWKRVMHRADEPDADGVHLILAHHKHHHRKETIWRDSRELDFRRGPSHGGRHLPKRRRRKLTFNLPDGFHFDVRHRAGRPFHVSDEAGTTRRFTEYTNIDPHGFVRGGR